MSSSRCDSFSQRTGLMTVKETVCLGVHKACRQKYRFDPVIPAGHFIPIFRKPKTVNEGPMMTFLFVKAPLREN